MARCSQTAEWLRRAQQDLRQSGRRTQPAVDLIGRSEGRGSLGLRREQEPVDNVSLQISKIDDWEKLRATSLRRTSLRIGGVLSDLSVLFESSGQSFPHSVFCPKDGL
jgi:hypothetical protein